MKKALSIILSLTFIVSIFSACSRKDLTYTFDTKPDGNNFEVSVVSFNVASPWGSLTNKTMSKDRVHRFAAYMKAIDANVIGTQEMNPIWLEQLKSELGYEYYAEERGGDENEKKSETNAIFWNAMEFTAKEVKTFWLSQTPAKMSRYENAGCNRVCSYVVLEDLAGNIFVVMNTHLDNASDEARAFGVSVIEKYIDQINQDYKFPKIILMGDFNDSYESTAYRSIIDYGFTDSINVSSGEKITPRSTYTDWGKLEDEKTPIDFIFTNATPIDYKILDDTSNGLVSDHYGIYSIIKIADK